MSSLPQQTRFRLNVSASHVVVLFGLLLMKFATSAPAPASISTLSSTVSTVTAAAAVDSTILLFEDSEFRGIRSRLYVGSSACVNLIGKLNDFFSSVDTMGGCYLLCEHRNCRGECLRVTGKVTHLSKLNDHVSSLRICRDDDGMESSSRTNRRDASGDAASSKNSSTRSSPLSSKFLGRRLRRSVNLKPAEESVPSSFSSNLERQRRTKRRGRTAGHHYHTRSSSDHSRIVTSPFPLTMSSSISNLTGTVQRRRRRNRSSSEEEDDNSAIPNRSVNLEVDRNPHLRLFRIRRHRRKRRGLIVRK